MVLRQNGELAFILNGNEAATYGFQLMATDGKVLAQTAKHLFVPGRNKINFSTSLSYGSILLLQASSDKEKKSLFLSVE